MRKIIMGMFVGYIFCAACVVGFSAYAVNIGGATDPVYVKIDDTTFAVQQTVVSNKTYKVEELQNDIDTLKSDLVEAKNGVVSLENQLAEKQDLLMQGLKTLK